MSTPAKQSLTVDESLQILQAKIKDLPNGDDLTVKLYRKRGGHLAAAGIPDVLATLSGARLAHVANPEMWIPRLAGAGSFLISVYSSDDQVRPLTAYIPFFVEGPSREVDLDAVVDPNWRGPARLDWPERRAPQQQGGYSVNLAPPALPLASAPQTQTSGTGAPGAHFPQQQTASTVDRHIADWMAQKERELAEARAALDLERERLRSEARFAQLEAKLAAQAEAARVAAVAPPLPPAPPKESIADILKAGMPLIQQVLTGQQEMRLAMMEVSQAQQAEMRELMKSVLTRPAIDPAMLALIERRDANEQPASAVLTQTVAVMTTMMENTMSMARVVAESSGAPAESPALMAFREITSAVEKIATASMQAPKPKPRPWRQPGPPTAGAAPASGGAVGASPVPTTSAGALPPASNVVPFQRPSEAVVDGNEQTQQLGGVDGLEEGLLGQLEQMIRDHEEPEKVAAFLVSIFNSAEFQDALQAANGSIPMLFQARLGAWSMDAANLPYGQALLDQVVEQGTAAGIFQDEEPNEEEVEG